MPAPPAKTRKYSHVAEHRGYSIATYQQATPVYIVGDVPVFAVYYVLDEMGDNLLPIDLPVWSPHIAYALVDSFLELNPAEKDKWRGAKGSPWLILHQLYRMQAMMPGVAAVLLRLYRECQEDGLDLFYEDAAELGKHIHETLAPVIAALDGAGPVPPHMQTTYGDGL